MIFSCSTSFLREPLEIALPLAAQAGYWNVDLLAIGGWPHLVTSDLLANFDAEFARIEGLLSENALGVTAVNFAGPSIHQRGDEAKNEDRIRQATAVAKFMNAIGAKVCSFYPGPPETSRPWEEILADAVASIRDLIAVGKAAGVTFAIEPHQNTPFETVEQNRRLLDAIPELAVAYDPSHFAMQEIPLPETAFLLDRAVHVHIRDAAPGKMCVPLGTGTVDFDWLAAGLRQRNYSSAVAVEVLAGSVPDASTEIAAYHTRFAKEWEAKAPGVPGRGQ